MFTFTRTWNLHLVEPKVPMSQKFPSTPAVHTSILQQYKYGSVSCHITYRKCFVYYIIRTYKSITWMIRTRRICMHNPIIIPPQFPLPRLPNIQRWTSLFCVIYSQCSLGQIPLPGHLYINNFLLMQDPLGWHQSIYCSGTVCLNIVRCCQVSVPHNGKNVISLQESDAMRFYF